MIDLGKLFQRSDDAARVRQTHALGPFLWLLGIACPTLTSVIIWAPELRLPAFLALLAVTIGAFIPGYYFMLKDPDRLHSESFQLRRQQMMMKAMRGPAPLTSAAVLTPQLKPVVVPALRTEAERE